MPLILCLILMLFMHFTLHQLFIHNYSSMQNIFLSLMMQLISESWDYLYF